MDVAEKTNIAAEVVKATPPVGVTVAHTLFGVPLSEWVFIVTIAYTVLQIYVLVRDKIIKRKRKD